MSRRSVRSVAGVSAAAALPLTLFLALFLTLSPALSPAQAAAPAKLADTSAMQPLFDCRKLPTKDERADCYDRAVDALQTAQAKGDVVVVDKEKIAAVRRQAFGFSLPSISLLARGLKEEPVKALSVDLQSARSDANGYWTVVTTEGAVWRQTQSTGYELTPHAGSHMIIRPGVLGAFFCEVDRQPQFRCRREQ